MTDLTAVQPDEAESATAAPARVGRRPAQAKHGVQQYFSGTAVQHREIVVQLRIS